MKIIKNQKSKIIFLFAIIFSVLFINIVSAGTGCCVTTTNGGFCDFVEENECDTNSPFAPGVTCDFAGFSECGVGACIDYDNAECMSYVPKITCEDAGLVWDENEDNCDNLDDWKEGCCVINDEQTYWESKIECKQRSDNLGNPLDFRDIDYNECKDVKNSADWGACVSSGGICTYGMRGECANIGGEFFLDTFCSDSSLEQYGVFCDAGDSQSCDDGDLYNFDSCNNREDIAEGCIQGQEICGLKDDGTQGCISLGCAGEGKGGANMENGESYCVYDGDLVEEGYAAPGSTHWKKVCDQGEIRYDSCGDGRTEICQEGTKDGELENRAFCVPNYAEECFEITSNFNNQINEEATKIFNENDEEDIAKYDMVNEKRNELVGKMTTECQSNNNCIFKEIETGGSGGNLGNFYDVALCLPRYPKEPAEAETSIKKENCGILDQNSKVFFKDAGADFSHRWTCVGNCNSLSPEFYEQMNDFCVRAGDCGLSMNYNEDWGKGGYAYEPDSETIFMPGFDIDTRKNDFCLRDAIWPHKGSFCKGKQLQSGSNVQHCKINVLEMFNQEENMEEGSMENSFQNIIKTNYEKYSTTTGTINPPKTLGGNYGEGDTQDILKAIIDQQHNENYGGSESFVQREGATWGWDSRKYMRKWQNKQGPVECRRLKKRGKEEKRLKKLDVEFKCLPWEAPTEGVNCNVCNTGETPCTKYKCESLGQSCSIINEDTDKPQCISLAFEETSPKVENIIYTGEDYKMGAGSDPWEINGGCFFENSKIEFNLTLDELARCKYGFGPYVDEVYEDMPNYPETGNTLLIEHSFSVNVPLIDSLPEEDLTITNQETTGDTSLSIRCRDTWGNFNVNEWVINYCIKSGPDEDAPQVTKFDPEEKEWPYNPENFDLSVHLNEEADCRYDYSSNLDYSEMVNDMEDCEDENGAGICITGINVTVAPGINKVYISCNDSSGNINNNILYEYGIERDISLEDYILSYGLEIDSIKLEMEDKTYESEDTLTSGNSPPTINLKVITTGGLENGNATCYYGLSQNNANIPFIETESNQHKQIFNALTEGDHTIYIKCKDDISEAIGSMNFTLEIDEDDPNMVSHSDDGDFLTVITDENAMCSYTPGSCNFAIENGEQFMDLDYSTEHVVEWNPSITYFIRCIDPYGNQGCVGQVGEGVPTGPSVTRIYYEGGNLKINTDRSAQCYYDLDDCEFSLMENENIMSNDFVKTHSINWNSATKYYIKCKDKWDNVNLGCAAIVQPNSIIKN